MNGDYIITTLNNGLRVVCRHTDGLVSYIGIVVNAGSRDEAEGKEGLAHFVEHTLFKGTSGRKSWQISSRMESVGGELNAYTSKEETVVYTSAPCGYEGRAVELLSDIIGHSVFPSSELNLERDVVIEEINSYLDSPSDLVYDEFEEIGYKGSGLAHNILGYTDTVKPLDSADCLEFVKKNYTPGEMVCYCVSPYPIGKMIKLFERYFGNLDRKDNPRNRLAPPAMAPFQERRDHGNHQANSIIGMRLFGRRDPRRHALFLLNNYLGGPSMNSRLNRELREKRGYVYTVDSSVALMSDAGMMMIYFGSSSETVEKCRRLVFNELDRLAQSQMSAVTLEKAKRQYCGQLTLSSDHRESRAMSLAKSLMYYGEVHDISHTSACIMDVTAEQVREVAELLNPIQSGMLTLS